MSICSLRRKPYVTLQSMKRTLLRRQSLWIPALALLLLGGLVLGIRSARVPDPEYKGRHLSEWMNMVRDDPVLSAHDARSEEAIRMLREMGTNAVPSLLGWMAYEPPEYRYHLVSLVQKLPQAVRYSRPLHLLLDNPAPARRASRAVDTLALLGPAAETAIPELVRRATTRPTDIYWATRARALDGLAKLGPPAAPFFQAQLSGSQGPPDASVIISVIRLGTNAGPLVPLLTNNLQLTNFTGVFVTLHTLGELRLEPQVVVPAVSRILQDSHPELRTAAAVALGKFGRSADPALPALTNCLEDPCVTVREQAAYAIQCITRENPSTNIPDIPPELPTNPLSH